MAAEALSSALSALLMTSPAVAAPREPSRQESEAAGSPRRLEVAPETVTVEGVPPERVRLSVSVVDRQGRPVIGLGPSDFIVLENGALQTLIDFGVEADRLDRPLSAVFLIDRSASIGTQMYKWKDACSAILAVLRPIDEVQVSSFDEDVEVLQRFTSDPLEVAAAVERLPRFGEGGTRFLSALEETIASMRDRRGRKVIFLLTDGVEQGVTTANVATNSAVARVATRAVQSQTSIVTILPGGHRSWRAAQDLAVHTGGWWLYSGDNPVATVEALGRRLLQSYYLVYDSPRKPEDQTRRRVEVSIGGTTAVETVVSTVSGVYGAAPLIEHLLEDLEEDDAVLRARAAAGLGALGDKVARKPLVEALEDDSPAVRGAAAVSLAERGEFAAVARIGRLLGDPDPDARAAAVRALGILMAKAPDEKTRDRILEALESIEP